VERCELTHVRKKRNVTTVEKIRLVPMTSERPIGVRTLALSRLWWILLVVAAVPYSVLYLDRPVSRFCERLFGHFTWADNFTDTPSFFHPIALLLFGIFLIRRLANRPLGKPDIICLLGDASLLLSDFITGWLKYFFGRTWPKYGFPSYIRQNVYGFNPFHAGVGYQSFPSGHVAALCADRRTLRLWGAALEAFVQKANQQISGIKANPKPHATFWGGRNPQRPALKRIRHIPPAGQYRRWVLPAHVRRVRPKAHNSRPTNVQSRHPDEIAELQANCGEDQHQRDQKAAFGRGNSRAEDEDSSERERREKNERSKVA
jgi:hypothetical protein